MGITARRERLRQRAAQAPAGPTAATASLAQDAYRVIKWRILTVQLRPGTAFTESELAESLGLGRTPIREALWLLRMEGLVEVEGRAGYRVASVTLREVRDLHHVRRLLEGEAASLAAQGVDDFGEVASLIERAPISVDMLEPNTISRWVEDDRRFHLALADVTGNRTLIDALAPLIEKSTRLHYMALALSASPLEVTHGHDDLIAALQARDGMRARQLAVQLIDDAELRIMRSLMTSPSVLTAKVLVEEPQNRFYLDVRPDELKKPLETPVAKLGSDGFEK
jgi:DNA-binding GntR family transcriptional regulator